jgi:hypothetical protein
LLKSPIDARSHRSSRIADIQVAEPSRCGSDQIAVYCVFDLVGTSRLRKTLAADRDVA